MMKGFWVTGISWGVCWHRSKRPCGCGVRSILLALVVLASAEEAMERRYALRARGVDLALIASRVSDVLGVKPEEVWAEGKYRRMVEARSLLCYWAVRELGVPMSSLARKLGISIPSVSESVTRGRRIAEARGCLLLQT